eukprot:gene29803-33643_t
MDRPAQFMYEGTRTFSEHNITIEIVVIQLFKYGLFEVLGRDQSTLSELRPVYLRSCIIEQRVQHSEVEALLKSSRAKFDPNQSLDEEEVYDLIVRASIFNDIADRLSLRKKDETSNLFEMEYAPAASDLEFGSDNVRRLQQLICEDPYRCGSPTPYKEITLTNSKEPESSPDFDPVIKQSPAAAPTGLGSMLRQLSAFFVPGMSGESKSKSEKSLQTEANSTVCLTQASGESSKTLSLSVRNKAGKSVNLESRKQPADKTPAQHDLANRILNRLKKLPDISEGSSGNEPSDVTNNLAVLASQFPVQDLDHKAVTPDQLSAYFAASSGSECERQSDVDARARIPHRQHPCLQPPKCVANFAVYTYAGNAVVPTCGGTVDVSKIVSAGA